jgi:hypothetical protein
MRKSYNMKGSLLIIFTFLISSVSLVASTVSVAFYSEKITLEYDDKIVANYKENLSDETEMVVFYKVLEKRPYQSYISSLQKAKTRYQLNDWLYYRLVEKSLDKICQSRSDRFQGVLSWFVMIKSDYDARATFTRSSFYVNVATREDVFESPMFDIRGETFANISAILTKGKMSKNVYVVAYAPNKNGKNFSFQLNIHPNLKAEEERLVYRFDYHEKPVELVAKIDKTLINIMAEYPKFDEMYFVSTPLSDVAKSSLLPALKKELIGKTEQEKIEFFVAFTRGALKYGSDKKGFGDKNKPLIAEEALFYPLVDCEDKVAVLYNLVKELTSLKGVVLAMPDHLSFAVDLRKPVGKTFRHKGKKYTLCDPTGPENSSKIGIFPYDTDLRRGEVLGEL